MLKAIKTFLIFILLLCVPSILHSQNIQEPSDSLKNKTYDELLDLIAVNYNENSKKAISYTHAYLNKSKNDFDNIRVIEGFYYLSELYKNYKITTAYIDSAITLNNKLDINNFHPLLYNQKGKIAYHYGDYTKALDNFVIAKEYAVHLKHEDFISSLNYNLGLMKLRIGDRKEALKIFKHSYSYLLDNGLKERLPSDYLNILGALSFAYWQNKKLDSASYFSNKEIRQTKLLKSEYHYNKARITEALINYDKKEFRKTLDSIDKYLPLIEIEQDSIDLAISYLYKGKSYKQLGDWENALLQFKKVDTILSTSKKYTLELRENYDILRDYYKDNKNLNQQLFYVEKLVDFDSTLYSNNAYVKKELLLKYDAPELIKEKEILIEQLQKNDNKKSNLIYILSLVVFILCILTFYFYYKRIGYKKSYNKLMDNYNMLASQKNNPHKNNTTKTLNVPEAIAKDILAKIRVFEDEKLFLKNTITLQSLAKSFGTNNNYLSRVVNFYMNKNFSTYLSDLRIHYVITALKDDPRLRKYTIKAIAFEVGFKNSESFTKAFYKRTKIYPSYFLKQLKKEKDLV